MGSLEAVGNWNGDTTEEQVFARARRHAAQLNAPRQTPAAWASCQDWPIRYKTVGSRSIHAAASFPRNGIVQIWTACGKWNVTIVVPEGLSVTCRTCRAASSS